MTKTNLTDETIIDALKKISSRVEEAAIDIHEMKRDLKFINLKLHTVEKNTEITKIDVEDIKQDVDDLIETSADILSNMVGQKELVTLSEKVISLEQTIKAS